VDRSQCLIRKENNMKPISIQIQRTNKRSSEEICSAFLDTERWSEFEGYSILPGIEHAQFEVRTPEYVGSRIKVQNKDGSGHVEEIMEWDTTRKVVLKFQDFTPPLKHLATHFIETWEFQKTAAGTLTIRRMDMFPIGFMGWLTLLPISRLMKKAFEKNAEQSA
jgi:hypothetical protein